MQHIINRRQSHGNRHDQCSLAISILCASLTTIVLFVMLVSMSTCGAVSRRIASPPLVCSESTPVPSRPIPSHHHTTEYAQVRTPRQQRGVSMHGAGARVGRDTTRDRRWVTRREAEADLSVLDRTDLLRVRDTRQYARTNSCLHRHSSTPFAASHRGRFQRTFTQRSSFTRPSSPPSPTAVRDAHDVQRSKRSNQSLTCTQLDSPAGQLSPLIRSATDGRVGLGCRADLNLRVVLSLVFTPS
jgi:hypothetical protein